MTGTGDKVRGHLVYRKGKVIHGFEEVGMWLEGTEVCVFVVKKKKKLIEPPLSPAMSRLKSLDLTTVWW